jgi:hypothetical protein
MQLIINLAARAILLLVTAWLAMIMLDTAHQHDPRVPAFSYIVTLLITCAVSCMTQKLDADV